MSAKPHRAIKQPGSKYFWIVVDRDGCEIGNGDGGLEKDQAVLMAASTDLLEAQTMGAEVNTPDFLDWLANRLVSVYGEKPSVDFVRSLRARAQAGREAIAKARGQS